MKTVVELITPAIAKELLKLNLGNRKLQQARVMTLAAAITRGEWLLTPQGIAIAKDGRLLDGQHRLEAICVADQSVSMLVSYNCDPAIFKVLDVGKSRSNADALHINASVAALARLATCVIEEETWYAKMVQKYTTQQLEHTLQWLLPYHNALNGFCSKNYKNRTVSSIRLAVIARMIKHPKSFTDVGEQYHAFVNLNTQKFWPGTSALLKTIDKNSRNLSEQIDYTLASTWIAFEPGNTTIQKIQVADSNTHIREIKACLLKASGRQVIPTKQKRRAKA